MEDKCQRSKILIVLLILFSFLSIMSVVINPGHIPFIALNIIKNNTCPKMPTIEKASVPVNKTQININRLSLTNQWQNRELYSSVAKKIKHNQQLCSQQYKATLNGYGMGSDIHTWSQALCVAMDRKGALFAVKPGPWKWIDKKLCSPKYFDDPLSCYFGKTTKCTQQSNKNYPSLEYHIKCKTDIPTMRAAATEYLFSNVSPRIINIAQRRAYDIFGASGIPKDLITVHIRWSDKKSEMTLQPIEKYIQAIDTLIVRHNITNPHIYMISEDACAYREFLLYTRYKRLKWSVHTYLQAMPLCQRSKLPTDEAKDTAGSNGSATLVALLIGMESKYYVLTTASNWSRVMNELRTNVVNMKCKGCTDMIDLLPGQW